MIFYPHIFEFQVLTIKKEHERTVKVTSLRAEGHPIHSTSFACLQNCRRFFSFLLLFNHFFNVQRKEMGGKEGVVSIPEMRHCLFYFPFLVHLLISLLSGLLKCFTALYKPSCFCPNYFLSAFLETKGYFAPAHRVMRRKMWEDSDRIKSTFSFPPLSFHCLILSISSLITPIVCPWLQIITRTLHIFSS